MSTSSANFSAIPIVDVDRFNWDDAWPDIKKAVESAEWIAIDCELSGLGDRKKLSAVAMEDRYENLCTVAKTRSIIALGLSCFTNTTDGAASSTSYRAETFNVVALCDEDYIVEPGAIRFLVQHGFDFQQQYNGGVMYCRGNDRIATKTKPTTPEENRLRDLFSLLVRSKKSLVAHNGLVDLVFLYQNLYAQLPTDLQSFIADLTEMFPGGIYDTKYMADFIVRSPASYLEYVFRREQRRNVDNCHVLLSFPDYTNSPVVSSTKYLECAVTPYHDVAVDDDIQPCDSYAHHGHCPDGKACKKSHDIDLILLKKEGNALRKGTTTAANGDGHEVNGGSAKKRKKAGSGGGGKANNRFGLASFGGHRAGFDAFMTGFAMVAFRARKENWKEHANKVYLVSKDFPLLVKKSAFAKISVSHFEKFARLKQTAEAAAAASDGGEA